MTEVNVLTAGRRYGAGVRRAGGHVNVGFGSTGRRRRSRRWTWKPEPQRDRVISKNNSELPLKKTHPTGSVRMVITARLSSRRRLRHRFRFKRAVSPLRRAWSAVPFTRLGQPASPRLVFIIRMVFLVLQPQSVGLFDERALLCFCEKSEKGVSQ